MSSEKTWWRKDVVNIADEETHVSARARTGGGVICIF